MALLTKAQIIQASAERIVMQARDLGKAAGEPAVSAAAIILQQAYALSIAEMIGTNPSRDRFRTVGDSLRQDLTRDIITQHYMLFGKRDS